ncbi:MAG: M1 family metallopeptidase [Candidatus Koribacter versatilis]|uniref:Aminopeptidase n=1 Tax=Candidatus Korobacter versatilis TaxID=658062 RepID=A0A932ENE0_9BACT|nr:M1 family metallopeptidase [Candidatus Koribacter versatilis]
MRRISILFLLCTAALALHAQRLPDTVTPHHYILKFTPDLKAAKFAGEETIHGDINRPTKDIVLNALEIEFQQVTVQALPGGAVQTAKVALDPQKEMATLSVDQELPKGPVEIKIKYTGILNDQLRGLYLSKGEGRNYATTQMEPTDARRAFPGWDEPAYKAPFDISVVADTGDTAISNSRIAKDEPGPGPGKHTITFAPTPKMSTYLVALAVGDWKCQEGTQDGIPIRICATPDKAHLLGEALAAAKSIQHYYNQWYAPKYISPKLDVLAVPDFSAGAMENTAAIFYREVLLFYDAKTTSSSLQKTVWDVLAHEQAHMWFGDLVTMQWWNDIWLNEGFATWMSSKPVRAAHPEWNNQIDEVDSATNAMAVDSLVATRPIRQDATTSQEIGELFDGIAYEKTAAVLRMLEGYEGPQVFQKGTNDYLAAHKYGNATAEDFWGAQTAASRKPIDKVMASFVLQPGVPLVSVDAKCSAGKTDVAITQQRFFSDRLAMDKGSEQLWQVPTCLKYGTKGKSETKCELVTAKQATITLPACADWVYANADARGYYRAAYSPASYKQLMTAAASLLPQERLALVDNQWALVRSGRSDVGDFLQLTEALRTDRGRALWENLNARLNTINRYLTTVEDKANFRTFVASLYRPMIAELGYTKRADDSTDTQQLRREVFNGLALVAEDPDAIAKAKELTQQEIKQPGSVDAELLSVAVAGAARFGDAALYDQYLVAMKQEKEPERHYNFVYGLTLFRQPELVKRSFELVEGPDIRNQDATGFVNSLVGDPYNQQQAWELFKSDWPALEKKMSSYVRGESVRVAGSFCDAGMRDDAKQFFASKGNPQSRTARQTMERINSCIDLKQQQQPKLSAWMAQHGGSKARAAR